MLVSKGTSMVNCHVTHHYNWTLQFTAAKVFCK